VSGALAERDFVAKLEKAGFVDVEIVARQPRSIDDFTMYPLFTPELIDLMRRLIPPEQQGAVATAVVVRARLGHHPAEPTEATP
jgi:arsenite methyltransferase